MAIREIHKLDELMDGALTERFNREFKRVLSNIFDPNTQAKTKREICLKIVIAPSESRDSAVFSLAVTSKVAPAANVAQTVFLDMDDDGRITATERTREVPGQIDMDGRETPMPRVLRFDNGESKAN